MMFAPEILPVVDKFSSPNAIEPLESVIEPFVKDKLPVVNVGAVNEVVIETIFGNPIVNLSVALTTASISFVVPNTLNTSPEISC